MIRRSKADERGSVRITFSVDDEGVPLSVVGSFNDWDPLRHPLKKRSNGTRSVVLDLPQGSEIHFRYLMDGGRFADDPDAELVHSGEGNLEGRVVV